jgi:DNA repair protein RecO (recombination protein O)
MIIRTEAVVLRALKYGETSQIVTLFTREKGKLAVIAKGSRLPKSRFGSTLQPMSYTEVVLYYKATRGLQTLTESAHVKPFHDIGRDLQKMTVGLRAVELIYALMQEEQEHADVFNLLLHTLSHLNAATERVRNLLPLFQMRLAALLGFAPQIDRDLVAALPDEGGLLDLDTGAVLPPDTLPTTARKASRTALRAYAIFARADTASVLRMHLAPRVRSEVEHLVDDYLRFHVEDAYPSRGEPVFRQLRQ